MENREREGENYILEKQLKDEASISPQEKQKKQQDDQAQNREGENIPKNPSINTKLGDGNQMEDGSEPKHLQD